jgi:hypothetical protein
MTSFEELELAIYHTSQKDAAHMLLRPTLITAAFVANDVQLTPDRLSSIKGLLLAIANDHEHDPITLRDRVMLDITHDLSFVGPRQAAHLNYIPNRLLEYLRKRYPQHAAYLQTITLKEMDRFQNQLRATIEENERNK